MAWLTQAEMVAAVYETGPTSEWKIANYSREIHDASEGHRQPTAPKGGLVADD